MKFIKLFSLLLIGSVLFLSSCDKDNIDDPIIEEEVIEIIENNLITNLLMSPNGGLEIGCVSINFPFQLETVNGDYIDITNEEDFENALFDSTNYVIDFVYPLDVEIDEEVTTVANIDEFGMLFAECIPDEGWGYNEGFPAFLFDEEGCYSLAYPTDLEDLDENVVTVNNQEEFIDALATNDILFFTFPLDLIGPDGGSVSASDEEALWEFISSCYVGDSTNCDSIDWGGQLGCYDVVFPINFELIDGSTATANDVDEMNELFLGGEVVNFAYPISLEGDDGIIVINSDEELEQAFENCAWGGEPSVTELLLWGANCYEVVYPLTASSGTVTIANIEELFQAVENGIDVDLPLNVITLDGVDHEINNLEELFALLDNC